jgi:hypothetical protein
MRTRLASATVTAALAACFLFAPTAPASSDPLAPAAERGHDYPGAPKDTKRCRKLLRQIEKARDAENYDRLNKLSRRYNRTCRIKPREDTRASETKYFLGSDASGEWAFSFLVREGKVEKIQFGGPVECSEDRIIQIFFSFDSAKTRGRTFNQSRKVNTDSVRARWLAAGTIGDGHAWGRFFLRQRMTNPNSGEVFACEMGRVHWKAQQVSQGEWNGGRLPPAPQAPPKP